MLLVGGYSKAPPIGVGVRFTAVAIVANSQAVYRGAWYKVYHQNETQPTTCEALAKYVTSNGLVIPVLLLASSS